MAFSDLTTDQQQDVLFYVDKLFRPTIRDFVLFLNHIGATLNDYDGKTGAILDLLLDADVIPDQSSYPGTDELTAQEIRTFTNAVRNIQTTYDTANNRQTITRVVGAPNTIG